MINHRFEVIGDCTDAMIVGRDLMNALGLILNFKEKLIMWEDCQLQLNTGQGTTLAELNNQHDHEFPEETKDASDNAVSPEKLVSTDMLDENLQQQYRALLVKYRDRYDGHLGRMKFPEYVLPITPDRVPLHAKPYPVPRSIEEQAKILIQKLINENVLERIYESKIKSPAFFQVKPNRSLRLLIDYRWLNKYLKRSPYYMPRIREVLMRLSKAKCISTFDANMGYYSRRLDPNGRPFTAFCLPFGKFQYKRLSIGISTALDE